MPMAFDMVNLWVLPHFHPSMGPTGKLTPNAPTRTIHGVLEITNLFKI